MPVEEFNTGPGSKPSRAVYGFVMYLGSWTVLGEGAEAISRSGSIFTCSSDTRICIEFDITCLTVCTVTREDIGTKYK